MYQSQVRPELNGRILVAQQPSLFSYDLLSSLRTDFLTIYKKISPPPRGWQIALVALLAATALIISGCGGVNYNTTGSTNLQALRAISCGTQSLTGAQTKTCSISLNATALSDTKVKLSTTSAALKVPSEVKIAVGQSSVDFDAVTSGVSQTATVTITATYRGVSKSAALTLYPASTGSGGSGSPNSAQHKVQLSWSAPAESSVALAGFNVYRATVGVSSYARLNPSTSTATSYVDTSVQSGLTYDYVVKSVDSGGTESNPSNATEVKVP